MTGRIAALTFVVLLSRLTVPAAEAQTAPNTGFVDFTYGTSATSRPTGEKPTSKLWFNDGSWWGYLFSTSDSKYHIYRLNMSNQTWVDTGVLGDDRDTSKGDVLWDAQGNRLYIASTIYSSTGTATSNTAKWGRLYRYFYDATQGRYILEAGYPATVNWATAEALTLAKDTAGRLWATWVENSVVMFNYTNNDDAVWNAPAPLPVASAARSVASDDISAVIAFGGGSIGVMWSHQPSAKTFFAVHRDADAPSVWQPVETVLPNSSCAGSCTDDHINLKTDTQGRIFAAVKTELSGGSQPLILLLVRGTTGGWTTHTFGLKSNHHTRPIVVLDEVHNVLYMFATSDENGGAIYYKTSSLANIAFAPGLGTLAISSSSDTNINDVTSTKSSVDIANGLVVLASSETTRTYYHNVITAGGPTVTSFTPASGAPGSSVTITGRGFTGATEVLFDQAPAVFTVTSDTEITATVPGAALTGRISVTTPAGTGTSSTNFTVTTGGGGGQTHLRDVTFEDGALASASTGVDRVNGSVILESGAPLVGAYSARIPNTGDSYLEVRFAPIPDAYLSFDVQIAALPSSEVRIAQLSNGGTTVGSIVLQADGRLKLKVGSTTLGLTSSPLLLNQRYRIGIHQKQGTGGNGVLEGFVAMNDDAFTTAFAATTTGTWTTAADRARLGATTGTALSAIFDDIFIDDAAMPSLKD